MTKNVIISGLVAAIVTAAGVWQYRYLLDKVSEVTLQIERETAAAPRQGALPYQRHGGARG